MVMMPAVNHLKYIMEVIVILPNIMKHTQNVLQEKHQKEELQQYILEHV